MELLEMKTCEKVYKRKELMYQLPREKAFLSALHPYHGFPKLLSATEHGFTMTWCGEQIRHALAIGRTSLDILYMQGQTLIELMAMTGIKHRNITANNLLWHPNGGLHIIDFGDSIWFWEPDVPVKAYPADGWAYCDMTDMQRFESVIWELKTGEQFTRRIWDDCVKSGQWAKTIQRPLAEL